MKKAKRVFIVEDDPSSRAVLGGLIHAVNADAEISSSDNAESAFKTIARERTEGRAYDLIIADIFLAGKDTGLDLWRRCVDEFRESALVVTSSIPLHQYFDFIGRESYAPIYLPKPYALDQCRFVLKDLLT